MQQLADAVQSLSAAAAATGRSEHGLAQEALAGQYAQFRQVVQALLDAEGKIQLFEYCLRIVLFSYLDVHFGLRNRPLCVIRRSVPVAQPAGLGPFRAGLCGPTTPGRRAAGVSGGAEGPLGKCAMVPAQQCVLRTFDAALAQLAEASPTVKRDILTAATACIAADGKVTLEESEVPAGDFGRLGLPGAADRSRRGFWRAGCVDFMNGTYRPHFQNDVAKREVDPYAQEHQAGDPSRPNTQRDAAGQSLAGRCKCLTAATAAKTITGSAVATPYTAGMQGSMSRTGPPAESN